MARFTILCVVLLCLVGVYSAPQFGGSFSQANAQAGAFGPGYGPGFQRPYYGPAGPPGYGLGGNWLGRRFQNRGGPNISISKSISISRGGGGGAQSSAQAGSFGK